jgi:hypothetical protein
MFQFREGKRRSLKDLAAQELSVKIQQQEHCPVCVISIYSIFHVVFKPLLQLSPSAAHFGLFWPTYYWKLFS